MTRSCQIFRVCHGLARVSVVCWLRPQTQETVYALLSEIFARNAIQLLGPDVDQGVLESLENVPEEIVSNMCCCNESIFNVVPSDRTLAEHVFATAFPIPSRPCIRKMFAIPCNVHNIDLFVNEVVVAQHTVLDLTYLVNWGKYGQRLLVLLKPCTPALYGVNLHWRGSRGKSELLNLLLCFWALMESNKHGWFKDAGERVIVKGRPTLQILLVVVAS